jgi:hypothetical protein
MRTIFETHQVKDSNYTKIYHLLALFYGIMLQWKSKASYYLSFVRHPGSTLMCAGEWPVGTMLEGTLLP